MEGEGGPSLSHLFSPCSPVSLTTVGEVKAGVDVRSLWSASGVDATTPYPTVSSVQGEILFEVYLKASHHLLWSLGWQRLSLLVGRVASLQGRRPEERLLRRRAQGCDMHLPQLQGDQGPANLPRPMSSWLHLPGTGLGEQVLTTGPGHGANKRKAGKLLRASRKTIL